MTRRNLLAAFVYEGSAFVQRATARDNLLTHVVPGDSARRYTTLVPLTPATNSGKKRAHMSHWNLKTSTLFLLQWRSLQ